MTENHPIVNTLVLGMTGSGKSALVNFMVHQEAADRGMDLVVMDPKLDVKTWGESFLHTDDQEIYLSHYWDSENFICVCDEAHTVVGLYNPLMEKTALMGRSRGHHNFFITNRAKGFSPTVIQESSEVFCFRCGPKNGADLAEYFSEPAFADCYKLRQYHFLHLVVWGPEGTALLRRGRMEKDSTNPLKSRIVWEGDKITRD